MMWIFAAAMALMLQGGEWLAMAMPAGFVTAHQQSVPVGSIEERIPKGETVERWTRMITLITINTDIGTETYTADFNARLARGCPGAKPIQRSIATIGDRRAIAARLDCPLNPATGKPETLFYRAISSGGKLHMAQVAFRSVPDAKGVAWAQDQLDSAMLCTPGATEPVCKR